LFRSLFLAVIGIILFCGITRFSLFQERPWDSRKRHVRKAAGKKNRKEKAAMAAGAENSCRVAEERKTVMPAAADERKAATTATTKQRLKGAEEKRAPMAAATEEKKAKRKSQCLQLLHLLQELETTMRYSLLTLLILVMRTNLLEHFSISIYDNSIIIY
jgi:hypothetical protein